MLAYRDDRCRVDAREALQGLRDAAGAARRSDAAMAMLIDAGMIEAGLVDAMAPERDRLDAGIAAARQMTIAAARRWLGHAHAQAVTAAVDRVLARPLPSRITQRVPEGFAYYALFPETYAAAAAALLTQVRPSRVCVIGLRSIGTTLAAVAHAALEAHGCPVWSCTVRPGGHPFARRVRLDAALSGRLRSEASTGAHFAIVDEGPGLSGSSFAAAADALTAMGVGVDRVVFLPAWDPAVDRLGNVAARRVWESHRRIHVDAAAAGIRPETIFGVGEGVDYSAGRWRAALLRPKSAWPLVQPQHERWKVRLPREGRLLKFVGLGRIGEAARRRAEALAAVGLGAAPGELRRGFLDLPFIPGVPWTGRGGDPSLVGRYVAGVARAFPAGTLVDASPLIEMILTNVSEIAGTVPRGLPRALDGWRELLADTPAAAIDGRMLPHEWIATRGDPLEHGRAVKVDALDHHRDHFYPGLQHPAWDLAAALLEFGWRPERSEQMLRAYERHGGDPLARRLVPFYVLAYAAFRAAYLTLAGCGGAARGYSQCALNAAACLSASSKSPRKQMARSSMNT